MTRRRLRPSTALSLAIALGIGGARSRLEAAPARVDCRILYETADGVFVDVGRESRVAEGASAWLETSGERVAEVETGKVGRSSLFLRVRARIGRGLPAAGEEVTLVYDAVDESPAPETESSPTLRDPTREESPFVPLLAPLDLGAEASTEASDIFHGRFTVQQAFQIGVGSGKGYSITRLATSGTLDRILASPWALEWDGELRHRDGAAFASTPRFRTTPFYLRRFALYRRYDERGFLRLGRFIPRELPAIGFVDGVQGETPLTGSVRVGGVAGFRPTRTYLEPTVDEPTVAPYVTVEAGAGPDLGYSGTAGLLFSLYRGQPDRLALLADQRLRAGELSINSSSEVDFDVGQLEARDGVRLTRWDVSASYRLDPAFDLRAGLDRFEPLESEAERREIDPGFIDVREFFPDGYWRPWVGAVHRLPWGLRLGEELSWTFSDVGDGPRVNLSLTRVGLPALPDGSVTLTVYNLLAERLRGYGGRLSAQVPLLDQRLLLHGSIGFRFGRFESPGESFFGGDTRDFSITDVSARAQWLLSRAWRVSGGVGYSLLDEAHRVLVDVSLTYRW